MDILELSLRMADRGCYAPVQIQGATEAETAIINERIASIRARLESEGRGWILPVEVDAMYNHWFIIRGHAQWMVRRATWDSVKSFGTLTEVLDFLDSTINRNLWDNDMNKED